MFLDFADLGSDSMIFNMDVFTKRTMPAILLVLLLGTIVYSNTFHVPFVLDDQSSIVNNAVITDLNNFFSGYRTGYEILTNRYVAYLTFAVNHHFFGLNIPAFHVVNLLIHLITALLVYILLSLTFQTPYFQKTGQGMSPQSSVHSPPFFIPLFAALLLVSHPIQTQAVTYIVQRVTSLATMFYLLSVVLYVKARLGMELKVRSEESGVRSEESGKDTHSENVHGQIKPWLLIGGSTLVAVVAMKTKEIAFTLPLAIVLYEIFFFHGAWKRRLLYLLPLLATLPIIPISILDFGGAGDEIMSGAGEQLRVGSSMSRLEYLFTQFRVIVTYLRLLVFPVNQNLDYDYPVFTTFFTPPVFLSFLVLTGIFALGMYLFFVSRPKQQSELKSEFEYQALAQPQAVSSLAYLRLIAFGIFWFFLTLSLESSLVPIKDVIVEYRLYLPFFGAAAAFATLFWLAVEKLTGPSSGKLLLLSAAILVLMLGVATYKRNHIWGNPVRLWQDVVAKSPNKARPINNLGKALEGAGRRQEAFKTLARAIEVDPNYYKSYYNLADLYLVSDQPGKALQLLQTAIRLNPNFTEAYVSVGAALMRAGKFREVTIFLEQNLDRIAEYAEARFYLGASHAFLGNREAAMRELAILSKLDASYAANLAGMMGLKSNQGMPH